MKKHLLFFFVLFVGATLFAQATRPRIQTATAGTVFPEDAPLAFTQVEPLAANLPYTVENWRGAVVQKGIWAEPLKPLVLEPLPCGYYLLKAGTEVRSFCVVVPLSSRHVTPEAAAKSVLALGVVQNQIACPGWFEAPWYEGPGATYDLISDLVGIGGFRRIRDCFIWPLMQPTRESPVNYGLFMDNANRLAKYGVATTCVVHNAPEWSDTHPVLPKDLLALYNFAKNAAATLGDRMDSWELWNEPDIAAVPEPGWDYAAACKVAALGFHAARPDKIVTNGSVAVGLEYPHPWLVFDSGIYKYTNVYNYHTYTSIPNYIKYYTEIHNFLTHYGIGDRAVWCTESGNGKEGFATGPSYYKDPRCPFIVMCHSPEQELIQAEFYPKSQIEHWFQGCARDYYFILCPYNEGNGGKDWGAMRRDGSVKAQFAAMSTATALLMNATLAGEVSVNKDVRVFLFDLPDGTQTICYWSKSELDTDESTDAVTLRNPFRNSFNLKIPAGEYTTYDLMGTPGKLKGHQGQTTLQADRFPAYVTGLHGLKADIKPILPQGVPQFYTPEPDEDLTVVIRADLNQEDFHIEGMKCLAVMPQPSGRMTIQVWNFDDQPKDGRLIAEGCPVDGLPETIHLPPMGKAQFDVVLKPTKPTDGDEKRRLVIHGVFNGKKSTPFIMPYFCEAFLELVEVPIQCANNIDAWKKNDCANESYSEWDEKEQAAHFHAIWYEEGGRWLFPVLQIQKFGESLEGAEYLIFDIRGDQDKIENDFVEPFVMLVDGQPHGGADAFYVSYLNPPIKAWETRRVKLSDDLYKLKNIYEFRIGACPRGKDVHLWIRNVRVLKRK